MLFEDEIVRIGYRMTQMVTNDGEVDYTLDDTNQLTDADYDYQTDEGYTYDENGNRTNAGYTTGPNNQLLTSSDGVVVQRVLITDKQEHDFPQNSGINDVE